MAVKRKYERGLTFVEEGFHACLNNVEDLMRCSDLLIEQDLHAHAMSLSVLALEEMGKLLSVDGLLFAKARDFKSHAFKTAQKSHAHKLLSLDMMPILVLNFIRCDPRYEQDPRFKTAWANGMENWKKAGNDLLQISGQSDFAFLNEWKQRGLYVNLVGGNSLQPPRKTVEPNLARAVHSFASMSAGNIKFALDDGNLDRYLESARSTRSKLSEADFEVVSRLADETVKSLFGIDPEIGDHDDDDTN